MRLERKGGKEGSREGKEREGRLEEGGGRERREEGMRALKAMPRVLDFRFTECFVWPY